MNMASALYFNGSIVKHGYGDFKQSAPHGRDFLEQQNLPAQTDELPKRFWDKMREPSWPLST